MPFRIEVDPSARAGEPRHRKIFESIGVAASPVPGGAHAPSEQSSSDKAEAESGEGGFWAILSDFDAELFVERYGYVPAFLSMYLLGLALTLTPCVYPIIPITIVFIGPDGIERKDLRIVQIEPPEAVLERFEKLKNPG